MKKDLSIKSKIILLNIVITAISLLMTFFVFSEVNKRYAENEIKNVAVQTIQALRGNLLYIFENVTQFSNLIYLDDAVQKSLKKVDTLTIDPTVQTTIRKSLTNMIISCDYISSVFVFDRYLNYYSSYKMGPITANSNEITSTDWYHKMRNANGNGFYIHGSEKVLEFASSLSPNYISYIREIRSKDDYEPMAILLVTIGAETIQNYFEGIRGDTGSDFFILDGNGNYIVEPIKNETDYLSYMQAIGEEGHLAEIISVQNKNVMIVSQELGIQDWRLAGAFPMNSMDILGSYYIGLILFVVCLNILFIFICSMLLTRLIFIPMSKLENHMHFIEKDEFIPIPVDHKRNEINHLKHVFNHMIQSIQMLIQKVKEEEQIIAKSKLDTIQAQINPHFLYNTLDAVSALALIKDHQSCFKMTQALGDFYRKHLNSGMDFVTVHDEIQCIQSYMTILNIRYGERIKTEYEIDEEILHYKMLKLVLQPIIENAVHHGINQNGGEGFIQVKGFLNEDELVFSVMDDGAGMTVERIQEILDGASVTGKSGFGIHGLIQRLQIYYKINHPITILSEPGSGTEVLICIKVMEEELKCH